MDSLDANQAAFTAIDAVNKWLDNNFGLSFVFFYRKNFLPSIEPKCPRYHVKDLMAFDGHVIATSMETALAMENAIKAQRYYYIYDLDWKREWKKINPDSVKRVLGDDKIIKFTRSADFVEELKVAGCTSLHGDVKDFDIDKILEIINANTRNA